MGFYGLNPDAASNALELVAGSMTQVAEDMKAAGINYFSKLEQYWASPDAKKFSEMFSPKLYEGTVEVIIQNAQQICNAMVNAYNQMAASNGLPTLPPKEVSITGEKNFGFLKEVLSSSLIGMNHEIVKAACEEYKNTTKSYFQILDQLSNIDISIYDPNGQIAEAMKNSMDRIKNSVESNVSLATDEVIKNIDFYAVALQTAADRSASSLETKISQ